MNGLLALVQALSTFIIGPFGIAVIVTSVAASFLAAAAHLLNWHRAMQSVIYGALAYSAAWAASLYGA